MEAKQSYPKDDMRRLWVKKSAEREKAIKQLRYNPLENEKISETVKIQKVMEPFTNSICQLQCL